MASLEGSRPGTDPPSAHATTRASASLSTYHAQLTQQLDAYYDRTTLLAVLVDFVRSLTLRFAARRLVPTNPYAPLLAQIRQAEISAHELLLARPRDLKTLANRDVLLFDPRDKRKPLALEDQIATFNASATLAVWAARAVIERIPYSSGWQRRADALYALFPLWLRDSESTDESCHVISVGAMVGANVFFLGAAQADAPASLVKLERHVIVSGDQLEPAMAVFARQQIRSLFEATKKHAVLPLADGGQLTIVGASGLVISSSLRPLGAPLEEAVWTLERVTANRQGFVTAVQLALVASGAFTMDLLYEHRVGSLSDNAQTHVVRCKLAFFFHFDHAPLQTNSAAPRPSASRSFVGHSRMDQSGICWTPSAAHEISRRIFEQRERDTAEAPTASRVPSAEERSLALDLVVRVGIAARTSSETRHWLGFLPSTEAWRLAQISSLLEIMTHTVCTASSAHLSRLLRSSIASYNDAISQLVQDARVDRSSSLLHGLDSIFSELCGLPEDPLAPDNLDALYQSLQRSQDTVVWLGSAAVRDFCQLVQRTTTPATADDTVDVIPCADLRADISAAIEARRFPLAIVAESVFAQYLVETKLDVALERSLVNTVASGLPPNPFVVLCTHLRVFARQHVETQERDRNHPPLTRFHPSVRAVGSRLYAMELRAESQVFVSANERLLAGLSPSSVVTIHQYLTDQHVYSTATYHPPKATYSARVISSLLVDDPLLLSSSSSATDPLGGMLMLQSTEAIEHVVIEGRDFAQALQFFADAVRRDILRLLEQISAHGQDAEVQLLDSSGDVVTAVELHDLQTFAQLVVEATPKQCLLQVVLPPVVRLDQGPSTEPLVRLVSKKYVFHHSPTEPSATGHVRSPISDAFKRRWQTFCVGFAVEEVQTIWGFMGVPTAALESGGSTLTAYAAQASRRHDSLLLDHLERMAPQLTDSPSPSPAETLLLRWLDVERVLEWLLHRLVFQQQTSLTPRSEAAALAAEAKALLTHVANATELTVVPRAAAMGMVDAHRVVDVVANVRSFCSLNSDGGPAAVAAAERLTRRLWTLVVIVRFASQADSAGGPAMTMLI